MSKRENRKKKERLKNWKSLMLFLKTEGNTLLSVFNS